MGKVCVNDASSSGALLYALPRAFRSTHTAQVWRSVVVPQQMQNGFALLYRLADYFRCFCFFCRVSSVDTSLFYSFSLFSAATCKSMTNEENEGRKWSCDLCTAGRSCGTAERQIPHADCQLHDGVLFEHAAAHAHYTS